MEPSRDNPLVRFGTFWLALGIFLVFALIFGVFALLNDTPPTDMEAAPAKVRYETKTKVDAAQAASLSADAIKAAIPAVARELAASQPVAVEKPEQLVPGAQPKSGAASTNEAIDPAVMERGKAQFLVCSACHGQQGEGGPIAPPLSGSEWVSGPIENLVRIQLRGLTGPITVKGTEYNFPAGMTPMAYQTDQQIADVLTYVRNSFGNKGSEVKPEQVAPLRGEVGQPLTVDQLTKP